MNFVNCIIVHYLSAIFILFEHRPTGAYLRRVWRDLYPQYCHIVPQWDTTASVTGSPLGKYMIWVTLAPPVKFTPPPKKNEILGTPLQRKWIFSNMKMDELKCEEWKERNVSPIFYLGVYSWRNPLIFNINFFSFICPTYAGMTVLALNASTFGNWVPQTICESLHSMSPNVTHMLYITVNEAPQCKLFFFSHFPLSINWDVGTYSESIGLHPLNSYET